MRTIAAGQTHPGKVRSTNEDQFLIANVTSAIQVVAASLCPSSQVYFGPSPAALLVVADGMGGHAAGDKASALAVSSLELFILRALGRIGPLGARDASELLRAAFEAADEAVVGRSRERASLNGMGTTMTAALVSGFQVHLAHAGDSRAYLLRGGRLLQLTHDHTVAAELQGSGAITAAEAAGHPFRHVVTNVIGGGKPGVATEPGQFQAAHGDRLLLCSDGLTDMVDDGAVAAILGRFEAPDEAAARLVQAALDAGGRDNVTALVATLHAR